MRGKKKRGLWFPVHQILGHDMSFEMVMMMVLIYIANQSYLVAVPAVLSLLLGRSFSLNMVPEPLELLPLGPRLLLEAYGSHDQ